MAAPDLGYHGGGVGRLTLHARQISSHLAPFFRALRVKVLLGEFASRSQVDLFPVRVPRRAPRFQIPEALLPLRGSKSAQGGQFKAALLLEYFAILDERVEPGPDRIHLGRSAPPARGLGG